MTQVALASAKRSPLMKNLQGETPARGWTERIEDATETMFDAVLPGL